MFSLVIVLTFLGGLLPFLAIGRAVDTARRRHTELDEDLRKIDAIIAANGTYEQMTAIRPPRVDSWNYVPWAPDIAERTLFDELRRPAYVGAFGVLCGMAGSLLSLALP